jgi:hypothetical protein
LPAITATSITQLGQDLRHHAVGLLQQRQQQMLGVNLAVAVAGEHLVSARCGVLRALGESVKSHHMS